MTTAATAAAIQHGVTGRIEALFDVAGERTRLAQAFCAAPLKIAKTFALEGAPGVESSTIGVCVMDASPGLLAGDRYEMEWRLEQGACVYLTTQGFTRVHPSRERPCVLRQSISLARGAMLEYFPQPLMLYGDAALRSECNVVLAAGATLLLSDVWCMGRIGRGEAFQFHSFENRLRVRYDGELVFVNQTSLRPRECDATVPGAWDGYTHGGSFLVFSPRADATLRDLLRCELEKWSSEARKEVNELVSGGVSLLHRHGVSVSLLGRRACDLQGAMQQLRAATRRHFGLCIQDGVN